MLTLEQRVYLVQCYGTGESSYSFVIEKFNQRYPNLYVSKMGLHKLLRKFQRTGSVANLKRNKKTYDQNDAATLIVLQSVADNPTVSLRNRAQELDVVKKSHIGNILKANKIFPFKPIFNHTLEEGDEAKRLDFCLWVGNKIVSGNRNFHKFIMYSDESTFSTNGKVSSAHVRYWSENNPRFRVPARRQYHKRVNVWCAISYYGIIGPYFFENTCNRGSYLQMLETFFSDNLEDLPLQFRNEMFFQQDGCPAHFAIEVREWLDNTFGHRWIGRNGPVLWPPRSPDLTISDAYLWGRLKQLVYSRPIENDEQLLKQRIVEAVQSISIEEIRRSFDHIRSQLEKCVQYGGGVFE